MSENSIFFVLALFICLSFTIQGQRGPASYSTKNKKAIEYFEASENYMVRRQYDQAIELLTQSLNKDDDFIEAHLRLGQCYQATSQTDLALQTFLTALALDENNNYPIIRLQLGELYFNNNKYNEAKKYYEEFIFSRPNQKLLGLAKQRLENTNYAIKFFEANKDTTDVEKVKLPDPLNNFQLQYFPALTADESQIFFTGRKGFYNYHDEDIYVSTKDSQGNWTEPVSVSENINSEKNEGTCSVSGDGRTIIYTYCHEREGFGGCDLYISYKEGDTWTEPANLGNRINSSAWESQPSLSADGRMLYFVSDRRPSFGGKDIYVSYRNSKGEWSLAETLGEPVNTKGDDSGPFIHANGRTLFYSTDGLEGFGKQDLYYSNLKDDGKWSNPKNLGWPINDSQDQPSIYITPDGRKGYFSSERRLNTYYEGYLYRYDFPVGKFQIEEARHLTGIVTDKYSEEPLKSVVSLIDLENGSLIQEVESDRFTGRYLIVIPEGKNYGLFTKAENYLYQSLSINLKDESINTFNRDIQLVPIKSGEYYRLGNVYFDFDDFKLKPESKPELDNIVSLLEENPDIKIQIEGHTDDKGEPSYNLSLSQKRARSVYDYLVNKGISESRLSSKGYGDSMPAVPNDSEKHRAENRRIVVRIL
ncbi:OmpA family protein [Marinigracilibium pacificum]|uniref:OmpA family protein n=1 Tax=Marinigracilibium pacificum TaxID=2729599 RepID=A0A848J4A2_9BACT|nr:OmpA family protein [Marinigracilibium pacificum]NMM49350.1 OmpA family protein [Marinigracilibium pacificum]